VAESAWRSRKINLLDVPRADDMFEEDIRQCLVDETGWICTICQWRSEQGTPEPAGLLEGLMDLFDGWTQSNKERCWRQAREHRHRIERGFAHFCTEARGRIAERERILRERRQTEEREARERAELMRSQSGLRAMAPVEFEHAVGSLFAARGWKVQRTPHSGDRGIDLVLIKNRQKVAVQCKRHKRAVGERIVREFYGSFVGQFSYGILVTTGVFSTRSLEWAKMRGPRIQLLDGECLARLMVETEPPAVREFPVYRDGRA